MKQSHGFTLIELMITVVIVAILSAIAIPKYNNYVTKAKFVELVSATAPAKLVYEVCAQVDGSITTSDCGDLSGTTDAGVIIITADDNTADTIIVKAEKDLTGDSVKDNYVITGKIVNGSIDWVESCSPSSFCQ